MRPLDLHVSALNDDEYTFYTTSLSDLVLQSDDELNESHDDAYFHGLSVGVRETRAWLRGRFSNVPASTVDSILRLFHPNLNQSDSLSGGQFFAALRLVVHVQSGKQFDRALAFVQAQPLSPEHSPSRPHSPSKWPAQSQPPPLHPDTPIRRLNQAQTHPPITPSSDAIGQRPVSTNPFSLQNPTFPQRSFSTPTNPFAAQRHGLELDPHGTELPAVPPLPPRKPPPPIPHTPPPRHASMAHTSNLTPSIKTSLSAPAHPSPPVPYQKSAHVTSNLMRQSLQASKAAQTMKRAEEELERERVLSVLKRSRAGSGSSSVKVVGGKLGEDITSEFHSDPSNNLPPLPRRRPHQVPSPPSSSTTSISTSSSIEHIESKSFDRPWDPNEKRPFPASEIRGRIASTAKSHFSSRPLPVPNQPSLVLSPERSLKYASPLSSPTRGNADLPQSHTPQVHPPPTHPDRKHPTARSSSTDSFDLVYPDPEQPRMELSTLGSTGSQPSSRMSRSKSLHHPSPPVPPPRRKRPESVQLTPTSDSPLPDTEDAAGNASFDQISSTPSRRGPRLSRNLSLSVEHERDSSPLMNIQRTIAKLDALQPRLASGLESLQPRLDRARYKAEAGLSWRGYLNHHGLTGKRDEGENSGLMHSETGNRSDASSASEEEGAEGVEGDRDNLKWPAGDGWHPL